MHYSKTASARRHRLYSSVPCERLQQIGLERDCFQEGSELGRGEVQIGISDSPFSVYVQVYMGTVLAYSPLGGPRFRSKVLSS